jgi:hypothetical protein
MEHEWLRKRLISERKGTLINQDGAHSIRSSDTARIAIVFAPYASNLVSV